MTQDFSPITPPPELVQQWLTAPEYAGEMVSMTERRLQEIADKAARRGADMELDACCEWLAVNSWKTLDSRLRTARRPKPPSLKEQALETLRSMRIDPVVINGINVNADVMTKYDIIRRALEALPD